MEVIDSGWIAIHEGVITGVGSGSYPLAAHQTGHDLGGSLVTPGLIDPHTHLVYGGNRAEEFMRRLAGESYEAIARAGGGILSTVRATRGQSVDELVESALPRLDALLAEGVTTVEVKSGYGLDVESELKMLRAARQLGVERPVQVTTTLLAAHAVPPEYLDNPDGYIDVVCDSMIPAAVEEGLADAVDGFCEGIAFSPHQIGRVFDAAGRYGLPVKLHAEQLSNLGGAKLAARYGALSADHLEHLDQDGVAAMSESSTVATLLPGAFYFTRDTTVPPLQLLRDAGVPIALGTDCNPGTSPLTSPLLTMNMAATLFRMTVDECLLGITRHAAKAVGLASSIGTISPGKDANLAMWDVAAPEELVYRIGFNPLAARMFRGRFVSC